MTIRIVRLGTARLPGEGLRVGTVRRPPRGVPKSEFASGDWYDVWYPELSPSADLVKFAQAAGSEDDWRMFVKRFRAEMAEPAPARTLALLAALSHQTDFAMGCYCEQEAHCHRSVLRALLQELGASVS
ncbi:MAG: DUF488 family protein [Perlucidibaca sp.]